MDWRFNTVWYDQLSKGDFQSIDFTKRAVPAGDLEGSYIFAHRFKSRNGNLSDFPARKGVKYLHLEWSNIRSLAGLSSFGGLKRLEVDWCLKLNADAGLSEVKQSLEWLHILHAKKFVPGKELLSLRNLKVLCLNSCGSLDNLEFLSAFPSLVDFRFVHTNVLSGDLTPLLKHPTLCSVGFLNKRHFNVREAEIDEHLRPRLRGAIKKTYRGDFETYRYVAVGAPNKPLQSDVPPKI